MINIHNAQLSFGEQIVFNNVSLTLNESERIGLVGRNGSGKSTLLKIIAQEHHLDEGTLAIVKNKTIGYMSQDVVLNSDKSVIDEALSAFELITSIEQKLQTIERQLEHSPSNLILIERYALLHEELAFEQPEKARAETERMLSGLGFNKNALSQKVTELSVGWKMRIVLAKLLLKKADFYLLDEPTNHLDIGAKDWFLDFLEQSSFGFMLVCHDRYFLDHLCRKILDLEQGKATFYTGNFSTYLIKKEHDAQLLEVAYNQQQKDITRKMATINRFRASASKAKMAQSMLKAVEKIERIELPPTPKEVRFNFPRITQPGRIVIDVKGVAQQFDSKQIFKDVQFQIERGQKVAVVAPNGIGKTTLFNIIANRLSRQTGHITFGNNTLSALFAQDQNQALERDKTILENINHLCPTKSEPMIRSFLGSFLFSGDDIHKKIGVLSGGEKNRVGMVSVLLQNANLFLLDEPTNHLDIPSKEILLHALQQSPATILFVSHDRDFINRLATNIIELTPTGTFSYQGNYESYLYHKKILDKPTETKYLEKKAHIDKNNPTNLFALKKESKKLAHKIDKLETKIEQLEQSFATIVYGSEAFAKATQKLNVIKSERDQLFKEWETIEEQVN